MLDFHHESNNNNMNMSSNVLQPVQQQQNHQANSPLAQFFNSNNFNNAAHRQAAVESRPPPSREMMNGQKISAPPGFNTKIQPQKILLANTNKETKLITPTMFAPSNNGIEKKASGAEPLTNNQLLQALNYLMENDEDFIKKVHEAYIKSFKTLAL